MYWVTLIGVMSYAIYTTCIGNLRPSTNGRECIFKLFQIYVFIRYLLFPGKIECRKDLMGIYAFVHQGPPVVDSPPPRQRGPCACDVFSASLETQSRYK